jgi:hypothetical protein
MAQNRAPAQRAMGGANDSKVGEWLAPEHEADRVFQGLCCLQQGCTFSPEKMYCCHARAQSLCLQGQSAFPPKDYIPKIINCCFMTCYGRDACCPQSFCCGKVKDFDPRTEGTRWDEARPYAGLYCTFSALDLDFCGKRCCEQDSRVLCFGQTTWLTWPLDQTFEKMPPVVGMYCLTCFPKVTCCATMKELEDAWGPAPGSQGGQNQANLKYHFGDSGSDEHERTLLRETTTADDYSDAR